MSISVCADHLCVVCVQREWDTMKPGMSEHRAAEHGTPAEQWWNNWILPRTPAEHPRIPMEYQCSTSGTPPEQWNHTKRVQANQLSSTPSLKLSENLWFSGNSREYRSQIIHSNALMGESWRLNNHLIFSSERKVVFSSVNK